MKLQRYFVVRTFSIALFFALLGFCYSIASQADHAGRAAGGGVAPRVIGSSTLRFLAPDSVAVPGDYDLGDACYGSEVTRYISATGGIRPYRFASPNLANLLGFASTLNLYQSGVLTGTPSNLTATADLAFQVIAVDSIAPTASNANRTFHLSLFPFGSQIFRFTHTRVNNGVLGQSYFGRIETLGGKGAVKITIVPGSVTFKGQLVGTGSSLASLGLSLAEDGTVYGRPLKAGLVGFTAHAVDAIGRIAKDRTNTTPDQPVTFNIEDTRVTQSDATPLAVTVKGNTARLNTDSASFSAHFNLNGAAIATLKNNRFAFKIGGSTFEAFLDLSGKIVNQLGGSAVFADGAVLSGSIDSVNGLVRGNVARANLSKSLDAEHLVNRSTTRYAVAIMIADITIASDTIDFATSHVGTRYGLNYKLGRTGQPQAGLFQMISVVGLDKGDLVKEPGDQWSVRFIIGPRAGIDASPAFDQLVPNGTAVGVRIGTNFSQGLELKNIKVDPANGGLTFDAKKALIASGVSKLKINSNGFSGQLLTFPIDSRMTGIPQASSTAGTANTFFNLALDINRIAPNESFHAEGAKAIQKVPVRSQWIDRVSKRP